MSSFVIDKVEYIKCAGLLYGHENMKLEKHTYYLKNLYRNFCKMYTLNLASVNMQYGDSQNPDTNNYLDVFEQYKNKVHSGNRQQVFPHVLNFFRSAMYQTENEKCRTQMGSCFYVCLSHLLPRDYEIQQWGTIGF